MHQGHIHFYCVIFFKNFIISVFTLRSTIHFVYFSRDKVNFCFFMWILKLCRIFLKYFIEFAIESSESGVFSEERFVVTNSISLTDIKLLDSLFPLLSFY
jgi:hypothetical protein